MLALVDALIGPLGGIVAAIGAALAIWLRGRAAGRKERDYEATQDDMRTIQTVREAQDRSRDAGGGWHDRLRKHRGDD